MTHCTRKHHWRVTISRWPGCVAEHWRANTLQGLPAVDYRVGRTAEWNRAQSQLDKERPDNYTQVKYTGSGAPLLKLTPKHAEVSVIHYRQEFSYPCSDLYFRKKIKRGCVVYLICRAFITQPSWFWTQTSFVLIIKWKQGKLAENEIKFSFICLLLLFLLPGFDPYWPRHVSFPASQMLLQPSVWTQWRGYSLLLQDLFCFTRFIILWCNNISSSVPFGNWSFINITTNNKRMNKIKLLSIYCSHWQ